MSANRKLDITPDEAEKLAKAMKDPEFRNLLFEYAKEYQNNGGTFPEVQQLSTPSKQQASTETSKILVIYSLFLSYFQDETKGRLLRSCSHRWTFSCTNFLQNIA